MNNNRIPVGSFIVTKKEEAVLLEGYEEDKNNIFISRYLNVINKVIQNEHLNIKDYTSINDVIEDFEYVHIIKVKKYDLLKLNKGGENSDIPAVSYKVTINGT